jgi:hypothetical protein
MVRMSSSARTLGTSSVSLGAVGTVPFDGEMLARRGISASNEHRGAACPDWRADYQKLPFPRGGGGAVASRDLDGEEWARVRVIAAAALSEFDR